MAALFARFFRRPAHATSRTSPRRSSFRPTLEALEGRQLLSTTSVALGLTADPVTAGVPFRFSVYAYDQNTGQTLTDYAGTVKFGAGTFDTGYTLPGDYTFQPADHGTHTFMATYNNPGWAALSAWDPHAGDGLGFGTALNLYVEPAAPTTLILTAPDQAVPGRPFQVTVAAQGPNGTAVPSYAGTIHFTSTDPKAVLPADYTFAPGAGSQTFAVTLSSPGRQTLTVTDPAAGLSASRGLDVRNNKATRFLLSSGSSPNVLRSQDQYLTVTAVDGSGAVDTTYFGTVHFTSSDPKAVLPADVTFSSADAGTKLLHFTLYTLGTQTLVATEVGGTLSGTITLNVKQGPATSVSVVEVQNNGQERVHVPFQVLVRAMSGTDPDYSGTLEFSIFREVDSGTFGNPPPATYTLTEADNGQHIFTATIIETGQYALYVKDGNVASQIVYVHVDHQGRFTFAAPAQAHNGAPFQFHLVALDDAGNPNPDFAGSVHFSSSDPRATLPADYTFTADDGGVHTFTAILRSNGAKRLEGGMIECCG